VWFSSTARFLNFFVRDLGFYKKFVVPHLIRWAMSNKDAERVRSQVIPAAHGRVLELGIGPGLNLPFYSSSVRELQGVDPSRELLRTARKKIGSTPFPVELIPCSAEELPVEDQVVDTVVITWTLCSIPNPDKALAEVSRVLKPGGELIFVEHGLASEPRVRAWQNRINSPWKVFAGGCNLNRPMDRLISSAGFSILQLETGYLPGLKPLSFTYKGSARKKFSLEAETNSAV
jgi:SAM-dependent methyltransferase